MAPSLLGSPLPGPHEQPTMKRTLKRFHNRGLVWSAICTLVVGSYLVLGRVALLPTVEYLPEELQSHESLGVETDEPVFQVKPVPIENSESRWISGLPGFQVFENVWYSDDMIRFFTSDGIFDKLWSDHAIPPKDKVVSGNVSYHDGSWSDLTQDELARAGRAHNWYGNTLFVNDGREWSFIQHYYHFVAEVLVGGIAALSTALNKPLKTRHHDSAHHHDYVLVSGTADPKINWAVTPWEPAWQDGPGLNELVFQGLFRDHGIRKLEWEELTKDGQWIYFERVVIIDRWASHRHNPSANAWNKMAIPLLNLQFPSSFLRPSRESLFDFLGMNKPPSRIRQGASVSPIPKIVYVDRQSSSRRLVQSDENGLMEVLDDLEARGEARVRHVSWEKLSPRAQVEVMFDADIILGLHGNGLTHLLWMPEGGTIIEIFPPGVMIRDYEVLSEMLNMRHYALWDNRVVPRSEWDTGSKGDEESIHNGTQVPLDTAFIQTLLLDVLQSMKHHRQSESNLS